MNCTFNLSGVYSDEGFPPVFHDFRNLEGTRFYCSAEAESTLCKIIRQLGPEGLHHIDIGDYHYLSLFWIREIRESFSLVLFDHHPDDTPGVLDAGRLHCGNWVQIARETVPLMHEVVWYGGPAPGLPAPGLPVYVSIDLDVLSREDAVTDWDQGTMRAEELQERLDRIRRDHRIIGIDVCGGLTRAQGATDADLARNSLLRQRISRNNTF